MDGRGMAVGMDGRPIERLQTPREAEEAVRLEQYVSRGMEAERKLSSDDGKFFLGLIKGLLETRINQLVGADIQAQTILNVLDGLGCDVAAGRAAADRLVKSRLRITGPHGL